MTRKMLKDEPAPSINPYFEKAAQKAGSANKAAQALKTSQSNISRLMGYGSPGDDLILRLAEYLGEDPEKLLLLSHAEYGPEKARPVWTELLRRFSGAAALLLALTLAGSASAAISVDSGLGENIHYQTYCGEGRERVTAPEPAPHALPVQRKPRRH